KGLGAADPGALLPQQLERLLGHPTREVAGVSPYFVPAREGTSMLTTWARQGIAVRVLTNAFEATDVAAVHAGYAKWRQPLLHAGVQLFELRSAVPVDMGASWMGSSGASLHAKTFAVDRARAF